MKIILTIFIQITILVFPQPAQFDFHSPQNKKKFADYLYCEEDYIRALEEYEAIRDLIKNDTIDFKIMLGYSRLGLYEDAEKYLVLSSNSALHSDFHKLYFKIRFQKVPSSFFYIFESGAYPFSEKETSTLNLFHKLTSFSYLYAGLNGRSKDEILEPFDFEEKSIISAFYDLKIDPPYKSPALAGILSAVVPGSGKIYAGEWGDGITAFLVTGLLAFLAYDNFRADHNTRAWIFTGLGTLFYAGNIYGSIASAQIFNARINFEFYKALELFLGQKNYFLPEYDFCN